MKQLKIAAGIVLYNPDPIRFSACLNSIINQVDDLYLYDNSEKDYQLSIPSNVSYIRAGKNKGIATALNEIMKNAQTDGYDWVITLDQDSVLPDDIVKRYREEIIGADDKLAIICPQMIDRRQSYMVPKIEPVKEFVSYAITSACCTSVHAWRDIGGFDDWLFIDLVDNEFCRRLKIAGYNLLRLNNLIMDHELGNLVLKTEKVQKFWNKIGKAIHVQSLMKLSFKRNVNPMRIYYTNRNVIYVERKLTHYGSSIYEDNYNCHNYTQFFVRYNMRRLLRAQNKKAVWKAIWKGRKDGLAQKVEPWLYIGVGQDYAE